MIIGDLLINLTIWHINGIMHIMHIFFKDSIMSHLAVSASEFKKHYGELTDNALKEPVIIQKHHRNALVIMAFDLFESLQNRINELEDLRMIAEIRAAESGEIYSGKEVVARLEAITNE